MLIGARAPDADSQHPRRTCRGGNENMAVAPGNSMFSYHKVGLNPDTAQSCDFQCKCRITERIFPSKNAVQIGNIKTHYTQPILFEVSISIVAVPMETSTHPVGTFSDLAFFFLRSLKFLARRLTQECRRPISERPHIIYSNTPS